MKEISRIVFCGLAVLTMTLAAMANQPKNDWLHKKSEAAPCLRGPFAHENLAVYLVIDDPVPQLSIVPQSLPTGATGFHETLGQLLHENPKANGVVFTVNGELFSKTVLSNAPELHQRWSSLFNAAVDSALADDTDGLFSLPNVGEVAKWLNREKKTGPFRKRPNWISRPSAAQG